MRAFDKVAVIAFVAGSKPMIVFVNLRQSGEYWLSIAWLKTNASINKLERHQMTFRMIEVFFKSSERYSDINCFSNQCKAQCCERITLDHLT
jgi:hypothetical protein